MDIVAEPVSYVPTSLLYPLVLSVVTLLMLYVYVETSRTVKYGKKMPGPPTVPIFGNALIPLGIEPKAILTKLLEYDTYGNVVRVFVGPKLFVFLMDPHDVEIILSSSVHIDKGHEYRYFKPWLGEGLLISSGEKWRTHRKIIAPTFHLNILKSFVPMFYENSRDLAMRMEKEIGKEFDVHDYLSAVTVDILLDTAMGMRKHSQEKTSHAYAKAVMDLCEIIHRRQYNVFLRTDTLFEYTNWAKKQRGLLDIIHGLTNRVIRTKKAAYVEGQDYVKSEGQQPANKMEQDNIKNKTKYTSMPYVRDDLDEIDDNDVGEKKRLAFLDMMLALAREENKLTDEEIAEEVSTIMFEGHDTTAAGSSFVLCLLGVHQDVQAKVYEEINGIFKGSDRQCTFQDTVEMKYLERVILETLRLYPPVPAIARQLNKDVKIVTKGYEIPKDATVIIPMFKIHRQAEYYPNPEKFDPDNFLPERMQNRHYYAFVPFSAGPRSCVGRKYAMLKLKVLLSTLLRKYKIVSDKTEKDFGLQVDIILKRSDGFRIKIEPREKQGPVSAF